MLKLNIGFNRKIGEANYSSRGASVNLEIEVESALVREPDRLQEKIDYMFGLAKASVDEQLNGNGKPESNGQRGANGHAAGNGHNGNGNGRSATQSQVRAVHAIASRKRIDLTVLLRDRFGVDRPDDLTLRDASTLIDELKNGAAAGGRR